MMAKKPDLKPTHKVSFYGVRCYMNDRTGHLWGVNAICEGLITVAVGSHNTMSAVTALLLPGWRQPGFKLKILQEYRDDDEAQQSPQCDGERGKTGR